MSMIDIIEKKQSFINNNDNNWKIFLYDHKKYIKENCLIYNLTIEDKLNYKNRFEHFLRDKFYINTNLLYLIYFINDMKPSDDFTIKNKLFIINDISILNILYKKYQSTLASNVF